MGTGALGAGVALWAPVGLLSGPYEKHEVQNRRDTQEPQLVEGQQANNESGATPYPRIAPSSQGRAGRPEGDKERQGVQEYLSCF